MSFLLLFFFVAVVVGWAGPFFASYFLKLFQRNILSFFRGPGNVFLFEVNSPGSSVFATGTTHTHARTDTHGNKRSFKKPPTISINMLNSGGSIPRLRYERTLGHCAFWMIWQLKKICLQVRRYVGVSKCGGAFHFCSFWCFIIYSVNIHKAEERYTR